MSRYLVYICLVLLSSTVVAASELIKITDADFDNKVAKSSRPVVVYFYAEWCGPCKLVAPSLEELSVKMKSRLGIVRLDVDESPAAPAKYEVLGVPAMAIFMNGKIISRQVGAAPQHKIEQWIKASALTKAPQSSH